MENAYWLPKGAMGTPQENKGLLTAAKMMNKRFVIHEEFRGVVEGREWPDEVHTVNYDQNTVEGAGWGDCIYYSFAKRTAKFVVLPYVWEGEESAGSGKTGKKTIYIAYEFRVANLLRARNPDFMKEVDFSQLMDQQHFSIDGKRFGYYFGYTSTLLRERGTSIVEQVGKMVGKIKNVTNLLGFFDKEEDVEIKVEDLPAAEEEQTPGNMFFACLPLDMRLYQYRFREMIAESQFNLASKVEEYALEQLGDKKEKVKEYVVGVFDKMKKAGTLKDENAWKDQGKEALKLLGRNMREITIPGITVKVDGEEITLGDICDLAYRRGGVLRGATNEVAEQAMQVSRALGDSMQIIDKAANGLIRKDEFNACLEACKAIVNQQMFVGRVCHLINFLSEIESWLPCVENLGDVCAWLATGAAQLPEFLSGIPFIGTLLKESGKQLFKFYGHWLRPIFLNQNVSTDLSLTSPAPTPAPTLGSVPPNVDDGEGDAPDTMFTLMQPKPSVCITCGGGIGKGGMTYYKVAYFNGTLLRQFFFPYEMFPDPSQSQPVFPQTLKTGEPLKVQVGAESVQYENYIAYEPDPQHPNVFEKVCFYLSENLRRPNKMPPWIMKKNNRANVRSIDIKQRENAQRAIVRRTKPQRAIVRRRSTPTPSRRPPRRETPAPGTIKGVGKDAVYWI